MYFLFFYCNKYSLSFVTTVLAIFRCLVGSFPIFKDSISTGFVDNNSINVLREPLHLVIIAIAVAELIPGI